MTFWQDVEKTSEMGRAYPWFGLGFVVVTLILMYLFPQERVRLRTALILFGVSLLGCGVAVALLDFGFSPVGSLYLVVRFGSLLLLGIALVNVASVFAFDGLFRAVRWRPAPIARDLIVALSFVAIALALLAQSGVDLRGIVATSAVLTAIVGFSLQDTLANVMAGIALQVEGSIRIGDWIRIDDLEGKVKEIRWRQTSLLTRNWDTVVIPNSALIKVKVMLLGRHGAGPLRRRRWVTFDVDLTHSPTRVIAAVEKALGAEPIPTVAREPAPHCLMTEIKNGDASYAVRYWITALSETERTDSHLRTRIYTALRRANIPLSIPAQSVILTEESSYRERIQSMESAQRDAALASLQFFQPLTIEERKELAAALTSAPFVKGEAMTRQGAEANSLYVITEGEAEVRAAVEGLSKRVALLRAGDYFGEMGLLTGEPRAASVIALTDVKCYRLNKEPFQAILQRRPQLAEQISETLAQRRVELDSVKAELSKEAFRQEVLKTRSDLVRRIRNFFGLAMEQAA